MKVNLVVMTAGKAQGQRLPITLSQFTIGRDPQCNLRPASAMISKRHCAILIRDGKVFLRDFDSTNGTFVNEVQIKGEAPLKNDDVLKVGPLEFKVAIEIRPQATKPTPPPADTTDDESVAAMLLALQEDGGKTGVEQSDDESSIPQGSTVMDMIPMPGEENKEDKDKKSADAKKGDAKQGDPAHLAAKAILEKYTRRQRR
ncbi:MAG: FHA domain-containing protein [Gemmataceae bacterium]|nr:FHA domain-containing protein [Gemmataceae bacterium]MCI0743316.1 FHA domain-containing protein [Gemmataceae bacterium]